MKEQSNQQNPKNTNEEQLFLETRSSGKPSTPKAEEGYCNEATQSGPLTHRGKKKRRAWTKEEIREVIWCYMYCRQHFTPGKHEVKELQETAILGTTHTLRTDLM